MPALSYGEPVPVYQVVLYLGTRLEKVVGGWEYDLGGQNRLDYRYQVISLGDVHWEAIAHAENPRLHALLPLVDRRRREADPEEFLQACRATILANRLPLQEKRDTVLAAMLLAGLVFGKALVNKVFSGVMAMLDLTKSTGYQILVEKAQAESFEKGLEKGFEKGLADMLVVVLRKRFKRLPRSLVARVRTLDADDLKRLGENVWDVQSLTDLERLLQ